MLTTAVYSSVGSAPKSTPACMHVVLVALDTVIGGVAMFINSS